MIFFFPSQQRISASLCQTLTIVGDAVMTILEFIDHPWTSLKKILSNSHWARNKSQSMATVLVFFPLGFTLRYWWFLNTPTPQQFFMTITSHPECLPEKPHLSLLSLRTNQATFLDSYRFRRHLKFSSLWWNSSSHLPLTSLIQFHQSQAVCPRILLGIFAWHSHSEPLSQPHHALF